MVRLEPGRYTFGVPSSLDADAMGEVKASLAPEMGPTSNCDDEGGFVFDARVFGEQAYGLRNSVL